MHWNRLIWCIKTIRWHGTVNIPKQIRIGTRYMYSNCLMLIGRSTNPWLSIIMINLFNSCRQIEIHGGLIDKFSFVYNAFTTWTLNPNIATTYLLNNSRTIRRIPLKISGNLHYILKTRLSAATATGACQAIIRAVLNAHHTPPDIICIWTKIMLLFVCLTVLPYFS